MWNFNIFAIWIVALCLTLHGMSRTKTRDDGVPTRDAIHLKLQKQGLALSEACGQYEQNAEMCRIVRVEE